MSFVVVIVFAVEHFLFVWLVFVFRWWLLVVWVVWCFVLFCGGLCVPCSLCVDVVCVHVLFFVLFRRHAGSRLLHYLPTRRSYDPTASGLGVLVVCGCRLPLSAWSNSP